MIIIIKKPKKNWRKKQEKKISVRFAKSDAFLKNHSELFERKKKLPCKTLPPNAWRDRGHGDNGIPLLAPFNL